MSSSSEEDNSFKEKIGGHLRLVKNPTERRTIAGLLRELGSLPLDHTRAAVETAFAKLLPQ